MPDDKIVAISIVLVFLGFFALCAHGCNIEAHNRTETQKVRGSSPTVTTCVEHSVLDHIQVVQ